MNHRSRFALLALSVLPACTKENPSFYETASDAGTSSAGSSGAVSTPTTGATSSASSGSGAGSGGVGETSGGVLTGGGTTGDPGTTTNPGTGTDPGGTSSGVDASSGGMSTGGSSSGGPDVCELPMFGEPPGLAIKKNGVPVAMACGMAKTISMGSAVFVGKTLKVYNSMNCTQTGESWEFTGVGFDITPTTLDGCTSVRIEWSSTMPLCPPVAFGVRNGGEAVYVGGFGRLVGPTDYDGFHAEPLFDCGCAVDGVTCCGDHMIDQTPYLPGVYTLGFPAAAQDIPMGEPIMGKVDGNDYLFKNLRSRVLELCAPIPQDVWLDMRWWAEAPN